MSNGGTAAPHHPLTEAEAKKRLEQARERARHSKTRKARNLWRRLVRKRTRQLREAIQRRKARDKPHVVDHRYVRGGREEERQLYAMRIAHKEFALGYLESTIDWLDGYALTNVPNPSADKHRTDCTWWGLDLKLVCGLGHLIKGFPRYTGSILDKGKEVSREYAEKHVGVFVVFGSGTAFHAGLSTGNGPNIYQHGTAPVEKGTFDQFGPAVEVRYRVLPA
jgi:hypothetical protein